MQVSTPSARRDVIETQKHFFQANRSKEVAGELTQNFSRGESVYPSVLTLEICVQDVSYSAEGERTLSYVTQAQSLRFLLQKCDENRKDGSCETCLRLKIACLGFGLKKPEWMRVSSDTGHQ
jgi:hypothetical protein